MSAGSLVGRARRLALRLLGGVEPVVPVTEPAPPAAEPPPAPEVEARPPALAVEAIETLSPFDAPDRAPLGVSLDHCVVVDEERVFLQGWLWDAEGVVEDFALVGPSGLRTGGVLSASVRVPRPPVSELYQPYFGPPAYQDLGFLALVALPEPWLAGRPTYLEVVRRCREPRPMRLPPPMRDPRFGREVVLLAMTQAGHPSAAALDRLLGPALQGLQRRAAAGAAVEAEERFGSAGEGPEASLIVPTAAAIEVMQGQLLSFAGDPGLAATEVLYGFDDPDLAAAWKRRLFHLVRLHDLPPVRVLEARRGAGPAAVVNAAAAVAGGRSLVLLHSDVVAERPGWLPRLLETHRGAPGPPGVELGVTGARLGYPDGTVQHGGYELARGVEPGPWLSVVAPEKGLPAALCREPGARPAGAVSGACLVIDRELFATLGGLLGEYALGDFEDVDLCRRAAQAGRAVVLAPDLGLVHLEEQTQRWRDGWGRNAWTAAYNRWLATRRWGGADPAV